MESFLFEALRDNKSSGTIGRKIGIDLYLDPLHGLVPGRCSRPPKISPSEISLPLFFSRAYSIRLLVVITKWRLVGTNQFSLFLAPSPPSFLLGWGRIEETVLILALKSSRGVSYGRSGELQYSRAVRLIFEGRSQGGDRLIFSRGGRKSRTRRPFARSPAPGYYWIECITSNDT